MGSRFETDLAEVAGDGNYLMICADRKTVFPEGAGPGRVPLADVAAVKADGAAIVARTADEASKRCALPSETPAAVAGLAERLAACIAEWR